LVSSSVGPSEPEIFFKTKLTSVANRVEQILPFKSLYTTQNRVLIANFFILPLLYYPRRFF
jgi:hypothetical protein